MTNLDAVTELEHLRYMFSEITAKPNDEYELAGVNLTLYEARILSTLSYYAPAFVSSTRLAVAVSYDQPRGESTAHSLKTIISRLRKKLPEHMTIYSRYARGYKLVDQR
jgi:DNA-binding response OmpR family regulator